MVIAQHYSKGCSRTRVYAHALYDKQSNSMNGVAMWLPPTGPAAKSVNQDEWQKVLSLTRLVIMPGVPKNACSFLLARSVEMIRKEGRFVSLVTYADDSQGHTGGIYKASNWAYIGRMKGSLRWTTPEGRQVSTKATVNRTYAQMEALGYTRSGPFYKHKFILHLDRKKQKKLLLERKNKP